MPTKRNKGGNQQNYVPAGNGDASGEYADNSTGSNIHFTNFKKPDDETTTETENVINEKETDTITNDGVETKTEEETTTETEIVDEKEQEQDIDANQEKQKKIDAIKNNSYFQSLTPSQKATLMSFVNYRKNKGVQTVDKMAVEVLFNAKLGNSFTISNEQKQLIADIMDTDFDKGEDFYIKRGDKWYSNNYKEIYDLAGVKTYTKEEMAQIKRKTLDKRIGAATEQDKNIQNILGGNTPVVFGKGYSTEQIAEIEKATQVLVSDFDGLKGFITAMGDRTQLENYLNAERKLYNPTEEQIQKEMARIKPYTWGSDEAIRNQAIRNLTGEVHLSSLKGTYAYWSGGVNRLIFMPKMKNAKESLRSDYESNYHPVADEVSVYYHEMGHAVDSMINKTYGAIYDKAKKYSLEKQQELKRLRDEYDETFRELRKQNYNADYQNTYNQLFKEKYGFQPDRDDAPSIARQRGIDFYDARAQVKKELREKGINRYNVSEYASTDAGEFLAECFAGHYCNANIELCTKTVNLIKDYYKKLKEIENGL